jgi:retron-type reverse transcriptase
MSLSAPNRIVVGGQQRIRRAQHYRDAVQRIRAQVWDTHCDELSHASLWQHLLIRWKIWREIRRGCKRLAPDHALYLTRHG